MAHNTKFFLVSAILVDKKIHTLIPLNLTFFLNFQAMVFNCYKFERLLCSLTPPSLCVNGAACLVYKVVSKKFGMFADTVWPVFERREHTWAKGSLRVDGLREKLCDELFCLCLMHMQCYLLCPFWALLLLKGCTIKQAILMCDKRACMWMNWKATNF